MVVLADLPEATARVLADVAAEREHAMSHDDRTPEWDDKRVLGQLRDAAVSQALADRRCSRDRKACEEYWTFPGKGATDKGYRQNLIRAMQFLCAEVERIDRSEP